MLKELEEFSIDNNGIEFLPETINELTKLRVLNARQNKLESFPNIDQLGDLEVNTHFPHCTFLKIYYTMYFIHVSRVICF